MFKTTFNYSVNAEKNQLSVSPTTGTIIRWTMYCIAPSVLMAAGFWLASVVLDTKTDEEIMEELDKAFETSD